MFTDGLHHDFIDKKVLNKFVFHQSRFIVMAKLNAFLFTSLDGYFKDVNDGISWHRHGEEEAEFSAESSGLGGVLLFGRRTFEMMRSFWPTPQAYEMYPEVAVNMNNAEKIVFSNTLQDPGWEHSRVVTGLIAEMKRLRQLPGKDMTLLGSGSILTQLANEGLLDELRVMIDPVALGKGTSIFNGLDRHVQLTLTGSRVFSSGVILLNYDVKA